MNNNRITLQYSVEESQLKFEIHRLICNALRRLDAITCDEPSPNSVLNISTADDIDALRTELAKIDILFADVSTIIQNYIDYKHQERVSSAISDSPDLANGVPDLANIDLNSLNEKLQNFKDNLQSHENTD
jgi:hypothetical protein